MVALCSPSPALLSPLGARLGSRPSVAGAPPAGASGSRPPPVQARAACLVATCTSEPGAGHRSLGRLPSCQPAIMRFNAAMLMLSDLTGLSHNLYKPSTLGKNRHVTYGQHTPARHRATLVPLMQPCMLSCHLLLELRGLPVITPSPFACVPVAQHGSPGRGCSRLLRRQQHWAAGLARVHRQLVGGALLAPGACARAWPGRRGRKQAFHAACCIKP